MVHIIFNTFQLSLCQEEASKFLAQSMLTYSDSLLLEVAPEFKEHMGRHSLVYAANVNIYW
jgi:hypothetical protein